MPFNCDRCGTEMKLGIAILAEDELPPKGLGMPTPRLTYPYTTDFVKVMKCPSCGRSLTKEELIYYYEKRRQSESNG